MLWGKLKGAQCSETVKSRVPSIWFVWKIWDFLVARGQKLGARGHQALLEHSPGVYVAFLAVSGGLWLVLVLPLFVIYIMLFLKVAMVTCSEGLVYQPKDSLLFVWWGWSNGDKNKKPKKILRASNKTRKNPMGNFWALKISESKTSLVVHVLYLQNYAAGIRGTTTNLQIVLKYNPKKP